MCETYKKQNVNRTRVEIGNSRQTRVSHICVSLRGSIVLKYTDWWFQHASAHPNISVGDHHPILQLKPMIDITHQSSMALRKHHYCHFHA